MSIKLKRPLTLAVALTMLGQGETNTFNVTYNNLKQDEFVAKLEGNDARESVTNAVLSIVKEWDLDYPLTSEGLIELENEFPGFTNAIIDGFRGARSVALVKN